METILVIEDDEGLSRGICFSLEKEGYRIFAAAGLQQGKQLLRTNPVDLVLLDISLPDGDGYVFCKELREYSDLPVIMLTARDLETDEMIGFEVGADDYITKPFSLSVLKARIAVHLRRSALNREGERNKLHKGVNARSTNEKSLNTRSTNEKSMNALLTSADLRMCKDTCKVFKGEQELDLSVTEYKLLKLFLENRGRLLLKEQILEAIWDKEANFVDENTLPVNIRRLRMKVEEEPSKPRLIKTIHGMGYLWSEGVTKNES
jgi:DNA-binding response OmpR family regulator